ncbi:unnamed protein product, partial [marine sediment metagenome]
MRKRKFMRKGKFCVLMLSWLIVAALVLASCGPVAPGEQEEGEKMDQWTIDKARDWYLTQPWLVGCNFLPSTAVNQLEMWQADTYDAETIDRELSWV